MKKGRKRERWSERRGRNEERRVMSDRKGGEERDKAVKEEN